MKLYRERNLALFISMRCIVYGAGSLGTVLGAYMTKAGIPVDLVSRNEAHVKALNEKGAIITGTECFVQKVHAILPQELSGEYDVILLLTKQTENEKVVTFLKPYLKEDGVLVTLQNGLPEPLIASIIGEERTIGCTVEWGATMTGPGSCEITSGPECFVFRLGDMPKVAKEKTLMVKALLASMCMTSMEENFMGVRWSKLLINATFSGLGTAFGGCFYDVYKTKEGKMLAALCIKECIDVARASGVTIAPVQGNDIAKLFYFTGKLGFLKSRMLIPIAMRSAKKIYPSMLQDLEKGKRCEIYDIDGVVCDYGRKYGVKTPVCDEIVRIVSAAEEKIVNADKENIGTVLKECLNEENRLIIWQNIKEEHIIPGSTRKNSKKNTKN